MAEPAPSSSSTFWQSPWVKAAVAGSVVVTVGYVYKRSNRPAVPSMENIVALDVGLATGAPKFDDVPACGDVATADAKPCLDKIADYMGSRNGFHGDKPDQASCAVAAVVVARDHRGDLVADPFAWMRMIKTGKGAGPDALRIAVARAMADKAPEVGKSFDDEEAAKKLIAAVAASIPGACDTYGDIARGKSIETMPPEEHPDHSACVQRDLSRRDGPGGRYGSGIFRAAEGAAALWREEERTLRMGQANASQEAQKVVADKLAVIEPLTLKIALKKVVNTDENQMTQFISAVHAEAGIPGFKVDAGAPDGGARDAGH